MGRGRFVMTKSQETCLFYFHAVTTRIVGEELDKYDQSIFTL
jgi:hypothetical protein